MVEKPHNGIDSQQQQQGQDMKIAIGKMSPKSAFLKNNSVRIQGEGVYIERSPVDTSMDMDKKVEYIKQELTRLKDKGYRFKGLSQIEEEGKISAVFSVILPKNNRVMIKKPVHHEEHQGRDNYTPAVESLVPGYGESADGYNPSTANNPLNENHPDHLNGRVGRDDNGRPIK